MGHYEKQFILGVALESIDRELEELRREYLQCPKQRKEIMEEITSLQEDRAIILDTSLSERTSMAHTCAQPHE